MDEIDPVKFYLIFSLILSNFVNFKYCGQKDHLLQNNQGGGVSKKYMLARARGPV